MATLKRQPGAAVLRPAGVSGAASGLASAARSTDAIAQSRRFEARVLDDTSQQLYGIAAQQRQQEADEAAASFVFQREAVMREAVVGGQKIVIRDENAAVAPALPAANSISIFDQRYRAAMQSRYLGDVEATSRVTLGKLAASNQEDPEAFGAASEGYMLSVQETSPPAMRGVITDTLKRVTTGLMSGLVNRKAERDFASARASALSHVEMLDADLVTAFTAGSIGQITYGNAEGAKVGSDPQLTATFRQIWQQWNQLVEAGFKTEPEKTMYFKNLGNRLAVAQVAHEMTALGDSREAGARRAATIQALTDGSLSVSVPTVDESGTVRFMQRSIAAVMDPTERTKTAGYLSSYAGHLDQAREAQDRLSHYYDSQRMANALIQVRGAITQGTPLTQANIEAIQRTFITPEAKAQWSQVIISADESMRAGLRRSMGADVGKAQFDQATHDLEGRKADLSGIGPMGSFVIESMNETNPDKQALLGPFMDSFVNDLNSQARAAATANKAVAEWGERGKLGANQNTPWSETESKISNMYASSALVTMGVVSNVGQVTPETYLDNPEASERIMAMMPQAPPQGLMQGIAGAVQQYAEGTDDPVAAARLESAVGLFRSMRANSAYGNFLKGGTGLPSETYNALASITQRADYFGKPITGPESQKRLADMLINGGGKNGLDYYYQQPDSWRDAFEQKVIDKLSDGPWFGDYSVPPMLVRAVVEEVAMSLSYFDNDVDAAVEAGADASLGLVLQNSVWGPSGITYSGGRGIRVARGGGVFGGDQGAWVERPPEVVYRGLGIREDQFAKWTQPLLDAYNKTNAQTLVLGRNAYLKPSPEPGSRSYDLVYLNAQRDWKYVQDSNGVPMRINFDVHVKDALQVEDLAAEQQRRAAHKRALESYYNATTASPGGASP